MDCSCEGEFAASTLGSTLCRACADPVYRYVSDSDFNRYIPLTIPSQVVQQMSVLHASVRIYLFASKTGRLYTEFLRGNDVLWEECIEALNRVALQVVAWNHSKNEPTLSLLVTNKKMQ